LAIHDHALHLCLIAALASACSFDASKLRASSSPAPDAAIDYPAASDTKAASAGDIAQHDDAYDRLSTDGATSFPDLTTNDASVSDDVAVPPDLAGANEVAATAGTDGGETGGTGAGGVGAGGNGTGGAGTGGAGGGRSGTGGADGGVDAPLDLDMGATPDSAYNPDSPIDGAITRGTGDTPGADGPAGSDGAGGVDGATDADGAHTLTEFTIPTQGSQPWDLAVGSDNSIWFTEHNGNKIGRCTMAGVITEFSIPTVGSGVYGIAAGPDNNL